MRACTRPPPGAQTNTSEHDPSKGKHERHEQVQGVVRCAPSVLFLFVFLFISFLSLLLLLTNHAFAATMTTNTRNGTNTHEQRRATRPRAAPPSAMGVKGATRPRPHAMARPSANRRKRTEHNRDKTTRQTGRTQRERRTMGEVCTLSISLFSFFFLFLFFHLLLLLTTLLQLQMTTITHGSTNANRHVTPAGHDLTTTKVRMDRCEEGGLLRCAPLCFFFPFLFCILFSFVL